MCEFTPLQKYKLSSDSEFIFCHLVAYDTTLLYLSSFLYKKKTFIYYRLMVKYKGESIGEIDCDHFTNEQVISFTRNFYGLIKYNKNNNENNNTNSNFFSNLI